MSISDNTLTNNRANYGGAIYVESSSVSISGSELTNNRADRTGGAINLLTGRVFISDSTLTNNRAENAGVISVTLGNVSISDSTLTNNRADEVGSGAIDVLEFSTLIIHNTVISNNIDSLNIQQSNVIFTGINIVRNNHGPINAFNSRMEFNGPTTLSNNRGVFGGAINADQSHIYININNGMIISNNTATYGGGIFLRESTIFVNETIQIYQNTAHQDGGGIYAYSSRVEFQSLVVSDFPPNKESEIAHNIAENGGGIYAVATTIELSRSHVNIDSNTATTSGGGVYLQQSSKLYLFKKKPEHQSYFVRLVINNNSAEYGGGIFVADDTESGACRVGATKSDATKIIFADCFIQTIRLHSAKSINQNYFNTFMTNNTATQSGADIYGGLLDRCIASKNAEYNISLNGLDYIRNTIEVSTEPPSISSRPVRVVVCNNSHISTRKGHALRSVLWLLTKLEMQ